MHRLFGVRNTELTETLQALKEPPALVITDSQVFKEVDAKVPEHILLTSFSILMARYKGFLKEAVHGVEAVAKLQDGDRVLIAEGCTHHRQCDDIGSVKIPRWLRNYTGREVEIVTWFRYGISGGSVPLCNGHSLRRLHAQ